MIDVLTLELIINRFDYVLYVVSKEKTLTFKVVDFNINAYNLEFKNNNVCYCISLNNIINIDFDANNQYEYVKIKLRDGDIIKLIKR